MHTQVYTGNSRTGKEADIENINIPQPLKIWRKQGVYRQTECEKCEKCCTFFSCVSPPLEVVHGLLLDERDIPPEVGHGESCLQHLLLLHEYLDTTTPHYYV